MQAEIARIRGYTTALDEFISLHTNKKEITVENCATFYATLQRIASLHAEISPIEITEAQKRYAEHSLLAEEEKFFKNFSKLSYRGI